MDNILEALTMALSWPALVAIVVGTWAGIIIGGLPGLGSVVGLTIFLPFTFGMDMMTSMSLLIGVYCGSVYGGSITAILINTPGAPQAAATTIDGHPMAKNGQAAEALGWATFASFFGGIVSCVILLIFAPILARFAINFGSIEVFALISIAMLCIVGVSRGNVLKGLLCGIVGIFISMVGSDPITGFGRFTGSSYALSSGISLIPVVIGSFALSELFMRCREAEKGRKSIPEAHLKLPRPSQILQRGWELLRGSFIGSLVGALPGVGAGPAAFMSYSAAQQFSPRRARLGSGEPDGVIAAESANNAVTGSAFIPTLTLGIPGGVVTALMMGAMVIHGITPGVRLVRDHPETMYSLFFILILVNCAMLLLSRPSIAIFRHIFRLPEGYVMAGIAIFSFIGAASVRGNSLDLIVAALAGLIGYALRRANYPLAPLVIGLVLGGDMESSLRRGLLIERNDLWAFFTHSYMSVFLFSLIFIFVLLTLFRAYSGRKSISEGAIS